MRTYRLSQLPGSVNLALIITIILILTSVIVPLIFREELLKTGHWLLTEYGQEKVGIILYLVTLISSSPVSVPVWTYAALGSLLGYEPSRLILVMSLGAMTGSSVTYFIGRYFGKTKFVRRNFPDIENHRWTRGKSVWVMSLILFGGAVSPMPFDVMYAACGMKRFPVALFSPILFLAWSIKLSVVVLVFKFGQFIPYFDLTL